VTKRILQNKYLLVDMIGDMMANIT